MFGGGGVGSCSADWRLRRLAVAAGVFCACWPAAGSGAGPSPRAAGVGSSSTRSGVLPRENGDRSSGFGACSGARATRSLSEASARSGGFGASVSTRGCTNTNCALVLRALLGERERASARRLGRPGNSFGESDQHDHHQQVDDDRQQDALAPGDGASPPAAMSGR